MADAKSESLTLTHSGVLSELVRDVLPNDSDIKSVAKFAVDSAAKSFPDIVPKKDDGHIYPYQITEPRKMKVIYTHDDKKPFLIQALDERTGKPVSSPLTWGMNYHFNISWPDVAHTFTHSFTISQHWNQKLYLLEHTFYKQVNNSKESCTGAEENPHQKWTTDQGSHVHDEAEGNMQTAGQGEKQGATDQSLPPGDSCTANSCPSSQQEVTLKILTFNIWNFNVVQKGEKSYTTRIKHLAELCLKSGADIIGFQEVRFQEGKGGDLGFSQIDHLTSQLPGYQYVYQPGQIHRNSLPSKVEEGLALFSKYPIVNHDYKLLTRNPEDNADSHQRVLLHVEVELPVAGTVDTRRVHVFNTHLSLSHVARQTSVVEIWNYINQFEGPAFLMGDFNAEAHNDEIKFLDGRIPLKGIKTSGLHDIWLMKHGSTDSGFTFSALNEGLFKRIDLIFMRDNKQVSLLDVALLDDGTRGAAAPSDHLGLLGTFSVKYKQ